MTDAKPNTKTGTKANTESKLRTLASGKQTFSNKTKPYLFGACFGLAAPFIVAPPLLANEPAVRIFLDEKLVEEIHNPAAPVSREADDKEEHQPTQAETAQSIPELATRIIDFHLLGMESMPSPVLRVRQTLEASTRQDGRKGKLGRLSLDLDWPHAAFTKRTILKVYDQGQANKDKPLLSYKLARHGRVRIPLTRKGGQFHLAGRPLAKLSYRIQLNGEKSAFDESELAPFRQKVGSSQTSLALDQQGIALVGVALEVNVSSLRAGQSVKLNKQALDIKNGKASARLYLPAGNHLLRFEVDTPGQQTIRFEQPVSVPKNDFFYAALGDVTLSARTGRTLENLEAVERSQEIDLFESLTLQGQAQLYLKGRILGSHLLSFAFDSGEGQVDELFKNLLVKDSDSILANIEPDKTYEVYGDASILRDETPQQEKLYIKIERGKNHLMWGSVKTQYLDNSLIKIDRANHGGQARFHRQMPIGDYGATVSAEAFATPVRDLQARNQLRGDGGFIYRLDHKDLIPKSELIRIEQRHPITGVVVNREDLISGLDYQIDYSQGQIVLATSLPANKDYEQEGPYPLFLIVSYRYKGSDLSSTAYQLGGRAQLTLGDRAYLSTTGGWDQAGDKGQSLYGFTGQLNVGQSSYIKGQIAFTSVLNDSTEMSDQPAFYTIGRGRSSTDSTSNLNEAYAWSLDGGLSLKDLSSGLPDGALSFAYRHRDAHFAGPGVSTAFEKRDYSANIEIPFLDGRLKWQAGASGNENRSSQQKLISAQSILTYRFNKRFKGSAQLKHLEETGRGQRTDFRLGLNYKASDSTVFKIFGEHSLAATPERLARSRAGLGLRYQPSEKWFADLDLIGASSGLTGRLDLTYLLADQGRLYLSYDYGVDPGTAFDLTSEQAAKKGLLKLGTKFALDRRFDAKTEALLKFEGTTLSSFAQEFGLNFKPSEPWLWTATGILDFSKDTLGDLSPKAVTIKASGDYQRQDLSLGGKSSYRIDRSFTDQKLTRRFDSKVFARYQANPNWKLQVDLAYNHLSGGSSGASTRLFEGAISAAYRPTTDDRLQAFLAFKAFYDLPNALQTGQLTDIGYKQRSHILSTDLTYQVSPRLSLGGKYGLKWGQITSSRSRYDWKSSTVHLLVGQARFNFARDWDALLEGRLMHLTEGNSTRYGVVAAIYRHFGDHMKIGVGHSFGAVSDDLTDITAISDGFFVNVVSKF